MSRVGSSPRSVIITSNLVFSEWDRIFKDPMTTAAAIDRIVHHSVILEMTGRSIRAEEAMRSEGGSATTITDPDQKAARKTTQERGGAPTTTTTTTTTGQSGKEVDGEM